MSDCVSSSEKLSTMTWLGGWSMTSRGDLGPGGQGKEARRPQVQARRIGDHFCQSKNIGLFFLN